MNTTKTLPSARLSGVFALARMIYDTVAQTVTQVAQWRHNMRSRRELAEMDAYMLDDIGLTREQALWEAHKPFWESSTKFR